MYRRRLSGEGGQSGWSVRNDIVKGGHARATLTWPLHRVSRFIKARVECHISNVATTRTFTPSKLHPVLARRVLW